MVVNALAISELSIIFCCGGVDKGIRICSGLNNSWNKPNRFLNVFCRQLSRADEWRRCLRIFHTRCILTNRSWRDVPLPARIALQVPGRRFACKCWSYSVRAGQRHFVILPEPPLAGCGWNRRTANLNFWISAGILVKVHCWPVFCGNRFQGFCISVADRVHPCFLLRIRLTGLLARIGPLFE